MADEASLVFPVDNVNDTDSEEEDEILRKQELQRLLNEELQDDLLDTSEEEEEEEENAKDDCYDSQLEYEQSSVFDHPYQEIENVPMNSDDRGGVPRINYQSHISYEDTSITSTNQERPLTIQDPSPLTIQNPSPLTIQDPSPLDPSTIQDPSPLIIQDPSPLIIQDPSLRVPMSLRLLKEVPYQKTTEESNVFHGTSQEYSLMKERMEERGRNDGKVCSSPYYYNSTATAGNVSGGRAVDGRDCFSELSHLDRQQLEALYVAKTRQLKEVEAEIKRVISDEERKSGILRHKVKLLESEKERLIQDVDRLKANTEELESRLKEYEALDEDNKQLLQEREELNEQLSTSQTTISLLTAQLNEMSNTEVLQKIRQNYESMITSLNEQHKKHSEELELEIIALQKELHQLQTDENDRQVTASCPVDDGGVCLKVKELDQMKKELHAEVEDLTFQLNTVQEELSVCQGKVGQLEQALCSSEESRKTELQQWLREEEKLKTMLEKLQNDSSNERTIAETNLKKSLEHCRSACLKLHEDSLLKLKEEFCAEKERIDSEYRDEINRLRQSIGKEKEKSRREREDTLQKQIDAALSSAHEAWKEDEEERFQTHLRSMLRQADKDHERKLADALKKKEIDWKAKCKKISDEGISSRQRSEREIVLLNKKLSEALTASTTSRNYEKLVSDLKSNLKSLQTALIQLMSQTLICFEEEKSKQLKETRQLALKEAERHYLSCLHALVNKKQ